MERDWTLLTTTEAAYQMGYSPRAIRRWIRKNKLPAMKGEFMINNSLCRYLIKVQDLNNFIEERKAEEYRLHLLWLENHYYSPQKEERIMQWKETRRYYRKGQ